MGILAFQMPDLDSRPQTTANGTLTHACTCRELEGLTVSIGPIETASLSRSLDLVVVSLNGSCGFGNAVPGSDISLQ